MEGFTPRELWLREQRAITEAVENYPDVPVPSILGTTVLFQLFHDPTPRLLAAVENALAAAFGVTFTGDVDGTSYALTAKLPSGTKVKIATDAEAVVEQRVTGQTVTDVIAWVRLPAEPVNAPGPVTGAAGEVVAA